MVHWKKKNSNPFQLSCCRSPRKSTKMQKDKTPEDEPPRLEGVQYATGKDWRVITHSSRKNEATEQKWKGNSVVDVSGGESKV